MLSFEKLRVGGKMFKWFNGLLYVWLIICVRGGWGGVCEMFFVGSLMF